MFCLFFVRDCICPPLGDSRFVTSGRMYGAGGSSKKLGKNQGDVYFSDTSSKSLNYSYGYWRNDRQNRCFMFLADVIMGNEYRPNYDKENNYRFNAEKAYFGSDGSRRKFDSISVKGGAGEVLNNEMIVWNSSQIRLKYLVEFNA